MFAMRPKDGKRVARAVTLIGSVLIALGAMTSPGPSSAADQAPLAQTSVQAPGAHAQSGIRW